MYAVRNCIEFPVLLAYQSLLVFIMHEIKTNEISFQSV